MQESKPAFRLGRSTLLAGLGLVMAALLTGCDTMPSGVPVSTKASMDAPHSESIILRAGDVLKITFPGSPNLDTVQPVRRDGRLNLPLIGETEAAGLTPAALQEKLAQTYAGQISTKQIVVQVQSSTFPVYVTGAVIKPGKVLTDHPLDALEAVMEAGGFNYALANMKHVKIVRNKNGVMEHFQVNLKEVLQGKGTHSFWLQPNDIVYVPEKLSPF